MIDRLFLRMYMISPKRYHAAMSGFNTSGVLSFAPARMIIPILLVLTYVYKSPLYSPNKIEVLKRFVV